MHEILAKNLNAPPKSIISEFCSTRLLPNLNHKPTNH
uniref:Putative chimeric protein 173-68 n=1 Tax=Trypanosoma cruzi TaxID=5693 RepID=Q6RV09_TRYCR|nr:putative chimeric protein 173-68 [Trypanosoma cruzi]